MPTENEIKAGMRAVRSLRLSFGGGDTPLEIADSMLRAFVLSILMAAEAVRRSD